VILIPHPLRGPGRAQTAVSYTGSAAKQGWVQLVDCGWCLVQKAFLSLNDTDRVKNIQTADTHNNNKTAPTDMPCGMLL